MAKVAPCPKNMKWVNPFLVVKDCDAALAFYEKAFGFTTRMKIPGPGGKTMHAEIAHKDSPILLGPESPERDCRSPETLGVKSPVQMYVYVDDVDALHKRASNAGATIQDAPEDMFWGDRICNIVDPDGHSWCFATHVKDVKPEEMMAGK
jgi:uncharacterized glyoxalase superfamily protein PhnB